MIVDLVRNDFSKIAKPRTVDVYRVIWRIFFFASTSVNFYHLL